MSTYRKDTSRMNFIIEEDCKRITIEQKWRYIFSTEMGVSNWTDMEKSIIHQKLNSLIDQSWSDAFVLKTIGNSDFAKKHKNTKWAIDFDISWVGYGEHWFVYLTKVPKDSFRNISSVYWFRGQIVIKTSDFEDRSQRGFYRKTILHEFGHTLRNIANYDRGDEYNRRSSYFDDEESIMNLGSEIKERHFSYLLEEINTMIPFTKFRIY